MARIVFGSVICWMNGEGREGEREGGREGGREGERVVRMLHLHHGPHRVRVRHVLNEL